VRGREVGSRSTASVTSKATLVVQEGMRGARRAGTFACGSTAVALATFLSGPIACSSGSSSSNGSTSPDGGTGGTEDSAAADATDARGPARDTGSPGMPEGGSEAGVAAPGAVGSGTIMCMYADDGGFDASCGPGKVCCDQSFEMLNTCASSFADCPCQTGGCTSVGCAAPADCPGMVCCADLGGPSIVATSCKAQCDSAELTVCSTANDCLPGRTQCSAYGGVSGTDISTCVF